MTGTHKTHSKRARTFWLAHIKHTEKEKGQYGCHKKNSKRERTIWLGHIKHTVKDKGQLAATRKTYSKDIDESQNRSENTQLAGNTDSIYFQI